ncbi:hypothetical protein EZY14_000985 [Kordia sp. TARA_039_SRF]|nr:hypothetical protein EZY14_000985 [Kordia sp. TARA_039_SRF]
MKTNSEIDILKLIWKLNYEWMLLLLEAFKNSQNKKGKIVDVQNTIQLLKSTKEKSERLKEEIVHEVSKIDKNKRTVSYLKSVNTFIHSTELDYYIKIMAKTKPFDFFDSIDEADMIGENSLKTNMDLVLTKVENNWIRFNQSNAKLIYKIHFAGYHLL